MSYARITNLAEQLRPVRNSVVAEELAVGGTAVSPATLNNLVKYCWVSVKTAAVLATFDDTDPATATAVGCVLASGYNGIWSRRMVECAKFIEATGSTPAVVRIEPLTD